MLQRGAMAWLVGGNSYRRRGARQHLELFAGQSSAEESQSAIRGRNQSSVVDVLKCRLEVIPDLVQRLDPGPRDRDHAEGNRAAGEQLKQAQVVATVRILDRDRVHRAAIERLGKLQ